MSDASFAVITGASSGIGLELAWLFAEDGFDLLVCAEDDGLEGAAQQLRGSGVEVTAVQLDLRTGAGVEALYAAIAATGRPVDAAAVNAGVGRGGAFVEAPIADLLEIVELNVASTVHLTRLLLADMVARNEGRLLLTSSIASTMPGSYAAVYNASKSFVQSLAEALQNELRDTEVTITSLMPGPTETNFFHRAEMDDTPMGRANKDDPADVARQGFEALMAGKHRVVAASLRTKVQELVSKVLPDRLKAETHRQVAEPDDQGSATTDPR
jgi:short-subunit dehydrogenase